MSKVAIVTVTYGDRWHLLVQVLDAVIHDPFLGVIIVVDNGSTSGRELSAYKERYRNKIHIIHNNYNIGSAGGFYQGLKEARTVSCDYVLMLDDDNVLCKDGLSHFVKNIQSFSGNNVVLLGRRTGGDLKTSVFYVHPRVTEKIPNSFFKVFGIDKIVKFFHLLIGRKDTVYTEREFKPMVEVESFAYGGTFLPLEAVKTAKLPQPDLFLYGDDIEYAWNVRHAGYTLYACADIIIEDIDRTFQEGDTHVTGMFSKGTSDFKVYFRMRNMVLISMRHTNGMLGKLRLVSAILMWVLGLHLLVLFRVGLTKEYFHKAKIVLQAMLDGILMKTRLPENIVLPGNAKLLTETEYE